MKTFRILSLDGGGVRGAYSAAALAEIEERAKVKIIDYFDLITGTSTGGILAIGLGLGFSAKDLLEFYQQKAKDIFQVTGLFTGIRQLFRTKYEAENLREALMSILKERKLGQSKRPLVITSYNASRNGAHLFKTYHHIEHDRHYLMLATDIAMATAAAPTYFRSRELPLGDNNNMQTFVDGGIWANCPILVGITEATKYMDASLENIDVFSIGTTFATFKIKDNQRTGGVTQWNLNLLNLIMSAQQAAVVGTANTLLKTPVVRITRELNKDISLDAYQEVPKLAGFGREDAKREFHTVKERFLNEPASPFKPVKSLIL